MSRVIIEVPDMGEVDDVEVVELLVAPGEHVDKDQSLLVLESDKASVEIPSTIAGVVHSVIVSMGDRVVTGAPLIEIETLEGEGVEQTELAVEEDAGLPDSAPAEEPGQYDATAADESSRKQSAAYTESNQIDLVTVRVPDLGDIEGAEVTECLCAVGDQVLADQAILVLESEKASLEITPEMDGEITAILVKVGAEVASDDALIELKTVVQRSASEPAVDRDSSEAPVLVEAEKTAPTIDDAEPGRTTKSEMESVSTDGQGEQDPARRVSEPEQPNEALLVHAGPAVRKLAREFGIQLHEVEGSGPHNRILKEDLQRHVRARLKEPSNPESAGQSFPLARPLPDFSRYGATTSVPMSKIRQLSARNLHESWVTIPHVTHFDEADITDLEDFRKTLNQRRDHETKVTPLAFFVKAVTLSLKAFPQFNASLSPDFTEWVFKDFINIGIAVETEGGLVVPNIKNADQLGLTAIAKQAAELAEQARSKKLMPQSLQGATFTISSLGGIGGTGFTPIINPPEVAILGVARAKWQPRYVNDELKKRLIVPLALSYDHRAIDGAEAARFLAGLAEQLEDVRYLAL
ncbi:MAG: dihydrolipoamide acetyltransferase [Gammaproteobacteria bacterium]|jgi:pyruvate dehydrogenase E2 component (dihydrolipoamide acetyltransferase)|nr:dihydrolipoamide acetyltransferase [Gammaproteobacteria bacterium]